MKISKFLPTALASGLVGLFLGFAAPAQAEDLPKEIHIAGGASFQNGELALTGHAAIIQQQGWLEAELKKRGVKLSWFAVSHSATGPMINEAFANHNIEFAGYGDLPSLILNASGFETRVVVPNGLGGTGDTYLVVPTNSTAKSIEDLKGKRLAIHKGRPWEIPLLRLLESKGLSYSDFQTYNIDPQAGAVALATGGVDALYTIGNDAFMLEERHVGKILWSTAQQPADWKMRTELWGAGWFIDKYPELTQLVVTAYLKAGYWASLPENREAAIRTNVRPGTPESIVRRVYEGNDSVWKDRWSPLFTPDLSEHYKVTESYAFNKQLISAHVDTAKLLDARFVNNALQDLQLTHYWTPAPTK